MFSARPPLLSPLGLVRAEPTCQPAFPSGSGPYASKGKGITIHPWSSLVNSQ